MDKKSLIFIVVSVLIFILMLYFVGVDRIISTLKLANLNLIALAILIQIFTYVLYTFRWKIINDASGIKVGFKKLFPIIMVGLAVNNITPSGRGGGEPVRAYILAREHDYPIKETVATVVADRMLDTFPFVVLAAITIFAMVIYFKVALWLIIVMILAVIGIITLLCLLIFMSVNYKFGNRVENWIVGLIRKVKRNDSQNLENKVHEFISGFQSNMKMLMSNKKVLYSTLPLSFLIWFFEILRVFIVFLAFGTNMSFIVIAEVFIVASLVGMVPLLPGGLGAVDGLMAVLYSKAGVALSLTAPITFIERLISFWMATIIGLIFVPYFGASVLDKLSLGSSTDDLEKAVDNEK